MIRKLYEKILMCSTVISRDEVTVYSAQASYYIIISAFPFIMLLLSLTGFLAPIYRTAITDAVHSIFPEAISPMASVLTSELFEKSIPLASLTAITALWSSSRGIAAVERGIRRVYGVNETRGFIKTSVLSLIYTVLFMGILTLTLLLQVFSNTILGFLSDYISIPQEIMSVVRNIFFFVFVGFIFQLMYYFLSSRQIPFKNHIFGAVFSTLGWMLFSWIYSIYIDNFADYSYIYGSLTAVVLMMLWLFCCVTILLVGAEVNKLLKGRILFWIKK